ncbi:MAG: hypothetical protein PHP63_04590 [Candidatus Marinimicrobia bacterium]|nr:hypothetical protein [Candidatus Neomarinimicrobiota bacterium]
MKKLIIIIILVLISVLSYGTDFYPYFLRFNPNNSSIYKDSCSTTIELENWKTYYVLFHDFWASVAWDPIILEIEWLNWYEMPDLPGITNKDYTLWAAENAIEAWNEVPYKRPAIFTEYDSNVDDDCIQIWVIGDLSNYPLLANSDFCGADNAFCIL